MKKVNETSPAQSPHIRRLVRSVVGNCSALAIACALVSSPCVVNAQSDNFDTYSSTAQLQAAGWILSSLNPALVNTTFPAVGAGKGLRIQAFPFPPSAPAVGMWYRTNDYTDFYVSVDIASWPGTSKDQAFVLFGRMTSSAGGGIVLPNQNPGDAQGIICNYNSNQDGESPTDRFGGEFQINLITAPFTASTLGACEMTLIPGRPYRMTFSGIGTHYVGRVYDWNDLTTPLVTIEADDGGFYTHGACGVLGLNRSGNNATNTVDITYDNYYAGTTDPNLATPPALSHPIPDTPVLATRTPAERWKNFLNPASGISFTANTYSANVINASATKLRLNGVDVSSQLAMSANGTTISGSLPGSVLTTNKLYSAELVVTDVAGTKSSTNTFWFDTFSDAFLLSPSVKTIELEEYNYSNGVYQLDPIPVSGIDTSIAQVNGFGVGYYDGGTFATMATAEIDYHSPLAGPDCPNWCDFRASDAVRTRNGGLLGIDDLIHPSGMDPGSDNVRSQHAASNLLEYVVLRTEVPIVSPPVYPWMNYTRSFAPGFYVAYLRYSSWGATLNELDRVTSDPTQPNQTAVKLGTFTVPNNIRYANYLYTPLTDDNGVQPLLSLTGTMTLRDVIAGTPRKDDRVIALNYLMLVKTPVAVYSSGTVDGTYTLVGSAVPDYVNGTISVPAAGNTRFYRVSADVPVRIKGISLSGGNVILAL